MPSRIHSGRMEEWKTSSSEIGKGARQQQHELRYAALARMEGHDRKVAAALQNAIDAAEAHDVMAALATASARPGHARLPHADEIEAAGQRLRETLWDFGLQIRPIAADGNCQFRAVADQLWGSDHNHAAVRERAVSHLRSNPDRYAGFAVGEDFPEYLNRMATPAHWGDNLSLQAIADAFQIRIMLITSFQRRALVVSPQQMCRERGQDQDRCIWLGFFAEWHYVSLESSEQNEANLEVARITRSSLS